jgi:hypothetical protein
MTVSRFTRILTLAPLALGANLVAVGPGTADVNVGPLSCVPTVPSTTAAELLYHEHYLINSPASTANRYVVCNIPFDSETLPTTFKVGAFGLNSEGSADSTSLCYANVVDLRNQHAPTALRGRAFLDNPGQDLTYTMIMTTRGRTNYLWSAWAELDASVVAAGMSQPPETPIGPAGIHGPAYWTITVKCRLRPGQALNMVKVFPTNWP